MTFLRFYKIFNLILNCLFSYRNKNVFVSFIFFIPYKNITIKIARNYKCLLIFGGNLRINSNESIQKCFRVTLIRNY